MKALLSFQMAYQHVRAGFGRVVLSIVAIALGVALVVAMQLMSDAVLASFLDDMDAMAGRAALTVTATNGVTFDEEVAEKLTNEVPGVLLAVPLVTAVAFPDDGSGELLTVHAVDLGNRAAVEAYHRGDPREIIVDKLDFLMKADSVVLARDFAERRRLTVGSTIDLVTPKGVKRFTVRGLLDPEGLARTLRGRLVVMDLYAAEEVFTGTGKINQIDLLVAPGQEETVKAAVAAKLPAGLTVEEPELRKDVIRKTVRGFRALLTAFSFLAVVAGFLVCFSRLATIFEARTWEVGLLRAVGLPRLTVFTELLKESLLLGIFGTAAGIPLGVVIGHYGLPLVARTAAIQFRAPVSTADPQLTVGPLVLGAAVGLAAALIAAILPAVRLARKQPVAALTMRGREFPAAAGRMRWRLTGALLTAIFGLIALQSTTNVSAIGNLTTLLLAVVACSAATPLVEACGHVLTRIRLRLIGPTAGLAASHLRQHRRRASLMVATLAVGLGVVLMFGMVGWSFERTLISASTARVQADFILWSEFISGGYRGAPISEALVAEVAQVPGVILTAGVQEKDVRYGDKPVVVYGYDAPCFRDRRMCEWPLNPGTPPDALTLVLDSQGALVSSSFAHQHGTRAGDVINLVSPSGPVALKVAGITSAEPVNAIIINRELYRRHWRDTQVSWVWVSVDPNRDRGAIAAAIRKSLGRKYRLRVSSSAQLIDYFAGQARQAFLPQYLMETVTFILVLIGTGETLATGVLERTREFGMVRAVGLSRSHLFTLVMLEGVTMGLLGLFLAGVAGMALGLFWVNVQFPALVGWVLDLHIPYLFASTAAGLALVLCIAGSVLPSIRAAHLSVPAALRNE